MDKLRKIFAGGIRRKIFSLVLITIVLVIAAYTAVFFYQSSRVERLVNETYDTQKQIYIENGLEDQYESFRNDAVDTFHREMFHARNILILLVALIVTTGLASAFSVAGRITDPLNTITRRVASQGVRNKQFLMEDVYRTGDEIEVLAESFAKQSARTIQYIEQIRRVTAEKERIGAELDVATHIQSSMLPSIFPAFPDRPEFDIYATMHPAKEVGGDFYDFFMVDDRHIAVVMADVSGKGVPAALFMVIGKTLIKDRTLPDTDLGTVFTDVNNILCESNSEGLFITAFEGVLDLVTGEFRFVNAGHEPPFVSRAGGPFELFKVKSGFILAGMEDVRYRSGSFMLAPEDKIFLYTDGVTEATNADNALYGMERLENALNRVKDRTPEEILPAIRTDIDAFVGSAPQFDDITMLCMTYKRRMQEEQ